MAEFDELDRILGVADAGSITRERPWVEDQGEANEAVFEMYEKLGLKRPKPVWAQSPRVIHEAIEMLRNIQVGMRHKFIDAMVPYDPDVLRREAQKTLLEALIDRNLSVTMGGCLSRQFPYSRPYELGRLPGYLSHALQPLNLGKQTAPAGWSDAVLYSVGLPSMVLQSQTFCVLPYVHLVWMCSPGKKQVDDVNTIWTWGDGYTIFIPHEEPEDEQPKLEETLGDRARPILSMAEHAEKVRRTLGLPDETGDDAGKSTPRLLEGE